MITLSKVLMHLCMFLLSTQILSLTIWYVDRKNVTAIAFAQMAAVALVLELQVYALKPLPNYFYEVHWGMPDLSLTMGAVSLGFFLKTNQAHAKMLAGLCVLALWMKINGHLYFKDGLASILLGYGYYLFSFQVIATFSSLWAVVVFTILGLSIIPKYAIWGQADFVQPIADYALMLLATKLSVRYAQQQVSQLTFAQFFSFFGFNRKGGRWSSK